MKVYVRTEDFGRGYSLYFVNEGPFPQRIIRPVSVDDNGEVVWSDEVVEEGVVMPVSLRFTHPMLLALREALNESLQVPADEELVRRLRLEETRVDKLIDYMMKEPGHG